MTTEEKIIKEFEEMLLDDGIPSENSELHGDGSISEWLKKNSNKHLYEDSVYNEPMLDFSEDKIKSFLLASLARVRDEEMGLVVSQQNQINDLKANARAYARKDLLAELRDGVERIPCIPAAGATFGDIIYRKAVLELLAIHDTK